MALQTKACMLLYSLNMRSMNIKPVKQNLRKAQAEERRLQIMNTALTVFASHGFKGTSIKDIAAAAGISQGLMYHYFASKEDLLEATVEYHSFLPQLRQILKDAGERPVDEVFNNIACGFLKMLDSKALLIRIFMQEIESNTMVKNAWANLCREGSTLLQEYVESQIAGGKLRPHKAEVTARCLFGIIFMYHFTGDIFHTSRIKKEEFTREALTNILNGISNI
jgi:AcrR family transcriptional regulator